MQSRTGGAIVEEEEVALPVRYLPDDLERGNRIENIRESGIAQFRSKRLE
jgi:hypothetical protein